MSERFRGAGYRLTRPRRDVLAALRGAAAPLTAQEVAARAGTSLASTYRALALLADLGMVAESSEPLSQSTSQAPADARSRRYTLCSTAGHHHHFICRSCHSALDIASEALERALMRAAAQIERGSGLRIDGHELTLRGQCAACQGRVGQ